MEIQLAKDWWQGRNGKSIAEIREQIVEPEFRIWNINACKLTDNAKNPCDQNAPQNIAFDILNNKDTCHQDTYKRQSNSNPDIIKWSIDTVQLIVFLNREKLNQCGTADNDLGVLKTDKCNKKTDADTDGGLQILWNRIENCFTYISQG